MKKLPRLTALAAASVLALGSVACSDDDSSENISDENGAEETEDPDEEDNGTEEDEVEEGESVVDALVGVWEAADPDEVGPHGSTLTVEENGDASYSSAASQVGPFEGPIVEDGERVVFEGFLDDGEVEMEWEILYNAEEDAMTMISESDEHTHHTRAE